MTYVVLSIIVVINVVATLLLWAKVANKSNGGPKLNKKAADALWHSDPIVPKHDPPQAAGGEFSSLARDVDRHFFAYFKDFADVMNWWLADEHVASRFRLQDLPDGHRSLNVGSSDDPMLGRSFAIYHNQTRVGRLEISPGIDYKDAHPEVYTSVEIDWARFFGFGELTKFLDAIAWHVTGNPKDDDYRDTRRSINAALTRTLWDNCCVSPLDRADDLERGHLILNFHGTASWYIHRRDALPSLR